MKAITASALLSDSPAFVLAMGGAGGSAGVGTGGPTSGTGGSTSPTGSRTDVSAGNPTGSSTGSPTSPTSGSTGIGTGNPTGSSTGSPTSPTSGSTGIGTGNPTGSSTGSSTSPTGGSTGSKGTALRTELESRLGTPLQGTLETEAPLARHTWFRTGGPAELLFTPASEDDLANFLQALPDSTPLTILGLGSNVLIRDGGIRGAVIRLARPFNWTRLHQQGADSILEAGSATPDIHLAREAEKQSLTGLEFFAGIPGSIGGALRMNAGAFGSETSKVLISARAIVRNGETREFSTSELGLGYRHSMAPQEQIYVSAKFRVHPADKSAVAKKVEEIRATRSEAQPSGIATGGSTFKNPSGKSANGNMSDKKTDKATGEATDEATDKATDKAQDDSMSAWKLIESVGGRGLQVGKAQVSEKHCNFLVNTGGATALELEQLGEELRRRVLEQHGIKLEWEIRRMGEFLPDESVSESAGEAVGKDTGEGIGKGTGESFGEDTGERLGKGTSESFGEGTSESFGKGTGESVSQGTAKSAGKQNA